MDTLKRSYGMSTLGVFKHWNWWKNWEISTIFANLNGFHLMCVFRQSSELNKLRSEYNGLMKELAETKNKLQQEELQRKGLEVNYKQNVSQLEVPITSHPQSHCTIHIFELNPTIIRTPYKAITKSVSPVLWCVKYNIKLITLYYLEVWLKTFMIRYANWPEFWKWIQCSLPSYWWFKDAVRTAQRNE